MDVGGPSVLDTTLKKPEKPIKNKSGKYKLIEKPTVLTKEPKHKLWSPVSLESDISSSENSDSEVAPIWTDKNTLEIKKKKQNHAEPSQPRQ
jgi:hypothetical protein